MIIHLYQHDLLVRRIKTKQRLLAEQNPAHAKISLLYVFEGGCMSGVFSGGVAVGLTETCITDKKGSLSLFDTADVMVGSSAGAPPILYGAAKQSLIGYSIYPEDLTNRRFINLLKPWNIMDTNYLMNIFQSGPKQLSYDLVLQSRPELYAVATHVKTGTQKLFNLKTPYMFDILRAAIHAPILAGKPPLIQDEMYVDGFSVPIKSVVETFRPTDLVIVLSYPIEKFQNPKRPFFDSLIGWLMSVQLSNGVKRVFLSRNRASKLNLSYLQHLTDAGLMNVGIIAPEVNNVGLLGDDQKQLMELGIAGAQYVLNLFAPEHTERVTRQMNVLQVSPCKSVGCSAVPRHCLSHTTRINGPEMDRSSVLTKSDEQQQLNQ